MLSVYGRVPGVVIASLSMLAACGGGGGGGQSGTAPSTNNSNNNPAPITFTVSSVGNTGGTLSPASVQVNSGSTTSATITPNTNFQIASVTGCGGSLVGNTYTTGAITANCTIQANFSAVTVNVQRFMVSVNATAGGTVTPTSVEVNSGNTTVLTITPNTSFQIASVTGCNGRLAGNTYTTGAITANCTVQVNFTAIGNGGSVTSWQGDDERPELLGSPTLSLQITPSRVRAVAPAGIFFAHSGSMKDYYYWNFGDGTSITGSQAAHIFEEPGEYTVEVERVDPETLEWGVTTVNVTILPFSGTTHYIDNNIGNDSASGNSPSNAWRSATKVQEYLNTVSDQNQRFLFKRGQVFPLPTPHFVASSSAQLIRFGAYANDNGSDNTNLPRPEIHASGTNGHMVNLVDAVADVVFQNLKFAADYVYATPPSAASGYPISGVWTVDTAHVAFLGVELTALESGIYLQGDTEHFFIHDSWVHHIQSHVVLGNVHQYSLQNNTLEYSSQAHIHYLGANEGVIRNNLIRRSGQSAEGWHQCGLRINSGEYQARRLYIARNHMLRTTGSPLCIGQNSPAELPSSDIVIEANIFNGEPPDAGEYWASQPIISLKSVQNSLARNNAFINIRGAVVLERNGAPFSNLRFLNNTFSSSAPSEPLMSLWGTTGDWMNIEFTNNIVIGAAGIVSFPGESAVAAVRMANNVLWNSGNEIVNWIGGTSEPFNRWASRNQGANNILGNPALVSLNREDATFLTPSENSPVLGAGQSVPVLLDFSGALRESLDVGARTLEE